MKINFIAALLVAITLCSCSHDKDDNFHANRHLVYIKLSANITDDSQDTKTVFSSNQNIWSEDDIIGVAIGENSSLVQFNLEEGAGTTKGVFTGEVGLFSDSRIYAVYPYMDIADVKSIPFSIGERVYQGDYQLLGDFSDYARYSYLAGSSVETYTVQDTTFIKSPSINMNYISSMVYFMIESFSEQAISIDSIDLICEGNEVNNVYATAGTLNLANSNDFRISPTQLSTVQTVNISPDAPLVLNNGEVKYVKMMSFPVDYEDGTDLMIRLNGHVNGSAITIATAKRIDSSSSIRPGEMRGLYIPISIMDVHHIGMAENAFAAGATTVKIEQQVSGPETINLPALSTSSNKSISIDASIIGGSKFYIHNSEKSPELILNNTFSGNLDNAGSVIIDLPQTPTFLSGKYKSITSKLEEDKLVVEKSAAVDSLGVRSGDVYIHGKVNGLFTEEDYNGRILIENEYGDMVDIIPVQEIFLTQTEYIGYVGSEFVVTYMTEPVDATFSRCAISSSDPQVASVENGYVHCNMLGTSVITLSAGSKRAYISVNVVPIPVNNIYLNIYAHSMHVGESVIINATVEPDDATDKTIIWSSSDDSIASVVDGEVIAHSVGTATITAASGGATAKCEITVLPINVTGISIDRSSINLTKNESVFLVETIFPEDATNKNVIWSSSNTAVATVSEGCVTAVGGGSATITVETVDGGFMATCLVSVYSPVTGITLNKSSETLRAGQIVTLSATITPSDATDQMVTWSSSDSSVAKVDNGVVTALKVGSTTITASAGEMSATCEITVEATPVTGVVLDKNSETLRAGQSVTLTATVTPADATDKTVTWSTSDASVATVKNGVVKALKVGTATITATVGEMSAECEITVEPTPVTGISLDKTSYTMFEGQIVTLVATVTPRDATDKTVAWSSSDASVATVSDGVVKALVPGSAVITAACAEFEATCTITVKQVDVLTLSVDAIEVESNGGANDITISSNINWEISSDSSWCTISPTSGSGNGSFTVTTSRNMTNGNRVAIITVIGNGETDLINKKVTVTQLKDNDNGVGSGDWENRGED